MTVQPLNDTPYLQILENTDWKPNILSQYKNVSYNIKLYMTPEKYQVDPTFEKINDPSTPKIVLAETGRTGLNIRNFEMDGKVALDFTVKNTQAIKFNMTIVEPMGATLIDLMYEAARELNIRNYLKIGYFIELSFRGYDENGIEVGNIGNRKWIWLVHIINVESRVSEAGAEYDITFRPKDEIALTDAIAQLSTNISITDVVTVGDVAKQLEKKLNDQDKEVYGNTQRHIYKIDIPEIFDNEMKKRIPGNKFKPSEWILPAEYKLHAGMSVSTVNEGGVSFTVAKETGIEKILETLIAHTTEAQKLIYADPENTGTPADFKIVWKLDSEVKLREDFTYDAILDDYNYEIKYILRPYATTRGSIEPEAVTKIIEDSSQNTKRIENRLNRKVLVKRYYWTFTGKNTEVLDFDIRLNYAYRLSLPQYAGINTYGQSTSSPLYNQRTRDLYLRKSDYVDATNLKRKIAQHKDLDAALDEREFLSFKQVVTDYDNPNYVAQDISRRHALERLGATQDQIRSESRLQDNQIRQQTEEYLAQKDKVRYAELLLQEPRRETRIMPISFDTDRTSVAHLIDGTTPQETGPNKSFYASYLNQIYGPTKDLVRIDIGVRGDPYWLGNSHVGAKKDEISDLEMNSFYGDAHFLLAFGIPRGYDQGRDPPSREFSAVFSGVYQAISFKHTFSNGEYKINMHAVRDPQIVFRGTA